MGDDSQTMRLSRPVQLGSETVEELTVRPTAAGMKDLELPLRPDGTVLFRPYELAKAGIRMSGRDFAVLDRMHPADVSTLAVIVLGFLGAGPATGSSVLAS